MELPVYAYGLDGGPPTLPGPTIRAREGEWLEITVVNNLSVETTVHFHGVFSMPHDMDGVPHVSQPPILPGGTFTHSFQAPPPGTYEYHSHVDVFHQIAKGLYGLLVVDDPVPGRRAAQRSGQRGNKRRYDREYPLVLGSYPTPEGPHDDIQLINGKTFYHLDAVADPDVAGKLIFPMNLGERVLFRIANFSNHVHPMHTHGMYYDVVAADGFDMEVPVRRDNLSVNAGERFDIICHADNPGAWLFHLPQPGARRGRNDRRQRRVVKYTKHFTQL